MPAKSVAQRKLFGIAKAVKKGELSPDEVSGAAADIAKNVSSSDIDKFAKTKEAGLPQHVEQKLREYIRKYIKEVINEINSNSNTEGLKKIEITGEFVYWPNDGWYLEAYKPGSQLPIGSADSYRLPDELVKQMGLDSIVKEDDEKWIQQAVNPSHKGYCSPMTKKTCTPKRKALAKRFKGGI